MGCGAGYGVTTVEQFEEWIYDLTDGLMAAALCIQRRSGSSSSSSRDANNVRVCSISVQKGFSRRRRGVSNLGVLAKRIHHERDTRPKVRCDDCLISWYLGNLRRK